MKLREKRKQKKNYENENSSEEEKTSGSEYEVEATDMEESEDEYKSELELNSDSSFHTSDQPNLSSNKKNDNKKTKRCNSESSPTSGSASDTVSKKQKVQDTLENSGPNSSLDTSINVNSVGPVLKNKKHEYLKSSDTTKNGCKTNICYFCFMDRKKSGNENKKVNFTKLVEHYNTAHPSEPEIIELNRYEPKKVVKGKGKTEDYKKRLALLENLRNRANHESNLVAKDVSEYVVSRRPQTENKSVSSFGSCYKCHKYLSLTSIRKHVNKCTGRSFKHRHNVQSNSRATIGDYCSIASASAINIIKKIQEDEVLDEIRYDECIFMWLNAEASKYETVLHHHDKIRANLRRLGRLKIEMRLMNEKIINFSDIFHEDHYEQFIEVCKILGKADPDTKFLRSASTANDMSYLIKHVADVYHVLIGAKEDQKRKEVEAFVKKIKTLWHSSIGNTIAESQAKSKRKKVIELPTTDDLTKLREYLEKEMLESYDLLRMKYTDNNYENLRDSTESYLHVTNCRRAGEVEKLSFDDYNTMQVQGNSCVIRVRGKRTSPVPIVFNTTILKYLTLLINNRQKARISSKNPFIFSSIHDTDTEFKYMLASTLMTRFSDKCDADNPKSLRGTYFRMQVATDGEEKGINEQEVGKLSKFLGHTPRIHCQNYRQSVFKRDVAVSNFVKEAQTNKKDLKKGTSTATSEKNVDISEQVSMVGARNYQSIEFNEDESNELLEQNQDNTENDQNGLNQDDSGNAENELNESPVLAKQKRLAWTQKAITDLMAHFPNSLKTDHQVPSANEIKQFLRSKKDDPNFKGRTEPQVRTWFHTHRKNGKTKNDRVSLKNNIPTYIYGKFERYIVAEKVPSIGKCAKFLAASPSRSHLTIKNIQDWVEMAIRRKSK